MNVEFSYRYRDFGNFKRYGSVVFGNRGGISTTEIDQAVLRIIGNEQIFAASELAIPEMYFTEFPYSPRLDWEIHEYCGVSDTDTRINDAEGRDIQDLITQLRLINTRHMK
ncbi:MAG: hypothetical protein ACRD25_06755 [Terracidiphilus sp.]